MSAFVERHHLWTPEQVDAAHVLKKRFESGEFDTIRFSFPDQHGILRGKTVVAEAAYDAMQSGVNLTTTLLAKDTSHLTVFPVFTTGNGGFEFEGMGGASDFTIVADPLSFKSLPWAPRTGWLLCDAYMPTGQASPLSTRHILRNAVAQAKASGYEMLAGLEVEFHVFKMLDPKMGLDQSGQPGEAPEVALLTHGYQYLTEHRFDQVDDVMQLIRTHLQALGLPLRTLEVEFGPSQFEITFAPTPALEAADMMILVRSAIKQLCRRQGLHATFMCRPKIPNVMSSGWHLHQSLKCIKTGKNVFMPTEKGDVLSPVGIHYLAGLLRHATATAAFATPTINGYRRYRPFSLAPDRASWAHDNRAAMLRVLGGVGQEASRIENRIGEPAANPYLYMASQLFSGMDGIQHQWQPGPSADTPYTCENKALPRSLADALDALRADPLLCDKFGQGFINYYCFIKEAELSRFNLTVSEWEQKEYFNLF
ncbi:glutamine synthetase family protein [Paenalcaligenes hominis]|uniref:glutamine synthetase family protein n=1 Tax=Paenalcaligenes hominis TaxID=643674 RepID=UPI003525CA14